MPVIRTCSEQKAVTQCFLQSQAILDSIIADQGECSLEHLRSQPDEEIKDELLKFNGVGPKTAACVLMFAMGRFEFPVVSSRRVGIRQPIKSSVIR